MTLPGALAVLITFMVIGLGALFAFHPPDATNVIIVGLTSTISTVFVMVFQYYFGSSSGSKDKDDTIKAALETAPAPPEVKPAAPASSAKLTGVGP